MSRLAHLCRSTPVGSIETRSLPTLTRSYPRRFTFYVAHPIRSIETRSLPTLTRSYPRRFTFYVAHPIRSIREQAAAATTVLSCIVSGLYLGIALFVIEQGRV
jgi:hypothetical protein